MSSAIRSWTSVLLILATLYIPSAAVPTRSRCHCTILSAQDSIASSSLLLSGSRIPDRCANLGSSLEYFRHTAPEIYDKYFPPSASPTTEDPRPLSTAVLLKIAAKHGHVEYTAHASNPEAQRPGERIVCRSEPEAWTEFHGSRSTLFSLQVIVAMAFIACIAECLSLSYDWFSTQQEKRREQALRLTGSEQPLRTHSDLEKDLQPPQYRDQLFSPEMDKKKQAYTVIHELPHFSSHRREPSHAYPHALDDIQDDDDEMNRPVL